MKTPPDRIVTLNQRLRQKQPFSQVHRQPDRGVTLKTGQAWSPAAVPGTVSAERPEDMPTWLLLLIEDVGNDWFNAVPIFRWTELAGPDDVMIPRELVGARMAAALALESTVNRDMLSDCQGRFKSDIVDFLLCARTALSEALEQNAYSWGAPYVGPQDHRIAYAGAISNRLEILQSGIRDNVFGRQTDVAGSLTGEPGNIIPFDPAWFEGKRWPAAASSGEQATPCIVLPTGRTEQVVRESRADSVTARCIAFDPLIPGSSAPVCCEWLVPIEYNAAPNAVDALVYDSRSRKHIGTAGVHCRKDGVLLTLTTHNLAHDDPQVDNPGVLRIVIVPRAS